MIKDIRPALRAFLLADSQVASAVGSSRIFPSTMPQGESRPSLVFNRVTGVGDYHMQGPSGLAQVRFQIDAYAQDPDAATALANLVKDRIDGFRGVMGDDGSPPSVTPVRVQGVFQQMERDDYQADVSLYLLSRDYLIVYEER